MLKASGTAATRRQASVYPTLSVVVPVYNGTDDLRKCLAALAASHYDNFEVLVVDDGSTEPVEPVATAYGFRYLRLAGPGGPARARNHGAAHVTGQYVVFIDADVCVHPDTLARFATAFAANPTLAAVVGSYDNTPAAPNFLSQYKNLFHHYVHQRGDGTISTFWSGCGAMRRELFLAFGGFDAQRYRRPAIEDIELGVRLWAASHQIVLDRQLQVMHLKRWTLWTLLKTDIFDRGVPWVRLMWRMGAMANTLNVIPTQRLSVVLMYLMMLAILAAVWWPVAWVGVALLAVAVTVINRDFYRYVTAQRGVWFSLRVVPLHWLYFGYCGFCVVWGSVLYCLTKEARLESVVGPRGRWQA
jgi:glycosyltransferase involved in cell wall biosynthesis